METFSQLDNALDRIKLLEQDVTAIHRRINTLREALHATNDVVNTLSLERQKRLQQEKR